MTLGISNFTKKSCFHSKINFVNFYLDLIIFDPPGGNIGFGSSE
jgi:hypothetical protein